jgi:hypothetical protein
VLTPLLVLLSDVVDNSAWLFELAPARVGMIQIGREHALILAAMLPAEVVLIGTADYPANRYPYSP